MFNIDKDVPLPVPAGRTAKYPWAQMQVGDSFFIPGMTMKNFGGTAYTAGKKLGHKYVVRAQDDGLRVWRTA